MVYFGYKSRKIFTIDCLAAVVMDSIWELCCKELMNLYDNRNKQLTIEIEDATKKIINDNIKLQAVNAKIKEQQQANPDKKKEDKKTSKKGSKDVPPSSPIEQQKADLEKAIENAKANTIKYQDKKNKIHTLKNKLQTLKQKVAKQELYVELVDKTGERKFVKTKLQQEANSFLSDRGIYYICTVSSTDQEEIEPLTHEGYPVRTIQEDATVPADEVVFSLKKDDKAKKGGKKK